MVYTSGGFTNLVYYFEAYGVLDFLLPFLLVFTISYAILQKSKVLGEKKFNIVTAITLGLLFVVPHIMGYYPLGYDPVQVLNESLPSISLVAIAGIMLLMVVGIFGKKFSDVANPIIAVLALLFVGYIFGSSLGFWTAPDDIFYWWSSDLTELLLILGVIALVIWLITGEEPKQGESTLQKLWTGIKGVLEDVK